MKKIMIVVLLVMLLAGCNTLSTNILSGDYIDVMELGSDAMESGEYEEAVNYFKQGMEYGPNEDTPLNNLSWAYNELEEYELALEYSIKAIEMPQDSTYEYTNKGNALSGLNRLEEAKVAYEEAIELDDDNPFAYYGLGMMEYGLGNLDQAISAFESAIKIKPRDFDYQYGKLECLYEQGELLKTYNYADSIIESFPDYYDTYAIKGLVMEEIDNEENIVEFYENVTEMFPYQHDAKLNIGRYYFYLARYKDAISAFEEVYLENKENYDLLSWLSYAYESDMDYEKAKLYAKEMVELEPTYYEGYNTFGNILIEETKYLESISHFEEAIEYAYDDTPYTNLLYAYSTAQRYSKCIKLGKQFLEEYPNSEDINWQIGYAYYMKNEYDAAIEYFNYVLEIDPSSDYMHYYIAECYYNLGLNELASESLDTFLTLYPEDYDGLELEESINITNKPALSILSDLFESYYLSEYNSGLLESYTQNDINEDGEIEKAIQEIKSPNDPYTFMVYGEDYDYFTSEDNNPIVHHQLESDAYYIGFNRFDYNTDHLFIEIIDEIPKSKNLVIDLRSNYGGLTDSSNNILNALLPELLISQLINKEGYTYPYYSDATQVTFNHIYILVDGNTASASELLTLALKTYLKDVTVVGEKTYGKGVGQFVHEDAINNRLYFIVSHFWNVREHNIDGEGIMPDIELNSTDLNEYLELVYEHIENN